MKILIDLSTYKTLELKKSIAFTLAEVLITLAIVGIIAAMTIQTLMTHLTHKKLESQLKKTYSELNIAARNFYAHEDMSVHDADIMLNKDMDKTNTFYLSDELLNKFMSYYKGFQRQTVANDRWVTFDNKNKINQKNLDGTNITSYPCDRSAVATDLVGRNYALDDTSAYGNTDFGPKICVDINGIDKPNRLGYDRFVFVFTEDAVVPYTGDSWQDLNENQTDEKEIAKNCSYSNSPNTPAFSCAYFALQDKSPSGNGSYWKNFLK